MQHVHSRERFSSPPPDSNSSRNCSRLVFHVGDATDNPSAYNQDWVSVQRWWDWCHRRHRVWLVVHGLYWTNERHVDTWTRMMRNPWRTEHWLERSDLCRSTCCLCDHSRWSCVDCHRRTNDHRLEPRRVMTVKNASPWILTVAVFDSHIQFRGIFNHVEWSSKKGFLELVIQLRLRHRRDQMTFLHITGQGE